MRIFVAILLLGLISCDPPVLKQSTRGNFLSIDSILNSQVRLLNLSDARLLKKVKYQSVVEEVNLGTTEVSWFRELDAFKLLEINKPTLIDAYEIKDRVKDSLSNLMILSYQLKTTEPAPVKMLNFYYLNNISSLKRVEAIVEAKTTFNQSNKKYEFEFDQKRGQTVLTKYSISSQEKQLFQKAIEITVECEVIY